MSKQPDDVPWWLLILLWVASIPASICDWAKRKFGK